MFSQEYPGQEFDGKVTRTAGALDPQSRTMQVEVQVPNQQGKLYAGMYGQVKFLLPDDNAPIVVPADAFVFRAQGPQVVTVTNDNRIHWQKISVGRDFGTQLEVLDGLKENTEVVMNPTDDLREGIEVQVKGDEKPRPQGSVAQSGSDQVSRSTRRVFNWNGAINNGTMEKSSCKWKPKQNPMDKNLEKVKLLARDLRDGKEFPRSPRQTLAGYVLAARAVDKCRAVLAGWEGDYHSNCPLDQRWLKFAEIDYDDFTSRFVATGRSADMVVQERTLGVTPRSSRSLRSLKCNPQQSGASST